MAVNYYYNNCNDKYRTVFDCTSSFFSNGILHLQGIVLIFTVVLLINGVQDVQTTPSQCENARDEFRRLGFNVDSNFNAPENAGLICGQSSCCNLEIENNFLQENRVSLNKFLNESVSKVSSLIDTRAKKFDENFRFMMNKSKVEFHQMFERTYGKLYLQNSDVFSDFFLELETYYKKGTLRLSETMDKFFAILYQRMFKVINSQYSFDDTYLNCVAEHMVEMKPFGDVPHKLGVQLRRSFVATRTFYKALAKGADAAEQMLAIKVTDECVKEMVKMKQCGICTNQRGGGACSGYCIATLENCFKHYTSFNSEWDNFIDGLDKVADRLVGPFNIEMVVEPLNIKISEAIMNFQDSGVEISNRIYQACGKPSLETSRTKRKAEYKNPTQDTPNVDEPFQPNKGGGRKKHKKGGEKSDDTPLLEKLIREIKTKLKDTKQFWLHLPYQFCNNDNLVATPSTDGQCWNGTSTGFYKKPKTTPAVRDSAVLNEQIYTLRGFTDQLRKAHQGEDVEFSDDTDEILNGSGSGSGDGDDFDDSEGRNPDGQDDGDLRIDSNPDEETDGNNNNFVPDYPKVAVTSTTQTPEVVLNNYNSAQRVGDISLARALAQYLIPIVLVWFGGAITDLL